MNHGLEKLVGQIAESRLNNRGEAGEGEHQPGGGLIVETVRGDQKGQDGGQRAAVYVARQMPERHKENFLFVHDDDLCPQAGTDEGKRAFPGGAKGRRGSHGTVDSGKSQTKKQGSFW